MLSVIRRLIVCLISIIGFYAAAVLMLWVISIIQ